MKGFLLVVLEGCVKGSLVYWKILFGGGPVLMMMIMLMNCLMS